MIKVGLLDLLWELAQIKTTTYKMHSSVRFMSTGHTAKAARIDTLTSFPPTGRTFGNPCLK